MKRLGEFVREARAAHSQKYLALFKRQAAAEGPEALKQMVELNAAEEQVLAQLEDLRPHGVYFYRSIHSWHSVRQITLVGPLPVLLELVFHPAGTVGYGPDHITSRFAKYDTLRVVWFSPPGSRFDAIEYGGADLDKFPEVFAQAIAKYL